MQNFPKQRLSYQDKIKDNYRWCKDLIDYLCVQHSDTPYGRKGQFERKIANYQLFNNQLNQLDFERECNPYGIEVGQFKDSIQPYNKTYNKIQVMLSEELMSPFNYKVVLVNSDGIKSKLEYRNKLLRDYVVNNIQQTISQTTGKQSEQEQVMNPIEINKYMKTTYLEAREILANKIMEYLTKKLSIPELKNDSFKHALLAGEEFTYVGTLNGEPHVSVLNTLGVFYQKSSDIKYVQDGNYAGYKVYLTSGEVLDRFGQYLSEEDLKKIDGSEHFGLAGTHEPTKDMRYYNDE